MRPTIDSKENVHTAQQTSLLVSQQHSKLFVRLTSRCILLLLLNLNTDSQIPLSDLLREPLPS